jgi:hypothetical protein
LVWLRDFKKERKGVKFEFFWVIILVLINILMAKNRWVAGYKWLRLGELGFFWNWVRENKKIAKMGLWKVIPLWLILEGILAIGQVSKGGSLNGWWRWLGNKDWRW